MDVAFQGTNPVKVGKMTEHNLPVFLWIILVLRHFQIISENICMDIKMWEIGILCCPILERHACIELRYGASKQVGRERHDEEKMMSLHPEKEKVRHMATEKHHSLGVSTSHWTGLEKKQRQMWSSILESKKEIININKKY